jgi:hypothetical protein
MEPLIDDVRVGIMMLPILLLNGDAELNRTRFTDLARSRDTKQ